jgi:hypothetical protein
MGRSWFTDKQLTTWLGCHRPCAWGRSRPSRPARASNRARTPARTKQFEVQCKLRLEAGFGEGWSDASASEQGTYGVALSELEARVQQQVERGGRARISGCEASSNQGQNNGEFPVSITSRRSRCQATAARSVGADTHLSACRARI